MSPKHRAALISTAAIAGLILSWAISTLWFGWPPLAPAALKLNAIILLCAWLFAPALWLLIEERVWKSEPDLSRIQQYERDFWTGAGVIVALLAVRELAGSEASTINRPALNWSHVIDGIRATIWPVVALIGFFLFREPLSAFFNALGTRASKIGAFQFSIELASLPEAKPWSGSGARGSSFGISHCGIRFLGQSVHGYC